MKTCVFVGPSAGDVGLPPGIDRYTPAALGSIWRAVESGYQRIALVDGLFGRVPAVWHKEILHAVACGVQVYGASSMGALRAAEMARYGMQGIGVIFRMYRAGRLTDDDEVCVTHGPRARGFEPTSLPMVSIRRTLATMVRSGDVERLEARAVCHALKQRHFPRRTLAALHEAFEEASAASDAAGRFEIAYEDLKTRDYRSLVHQLSHALPPELPSLPPWAELETSKWRFQFVEEAEDIPELQPW